MSKRVLFSALGLFVASGTIVFFWPANGFWPGQSDRWVIDEARAAIQSNLRDPGSAQFSDEVVLGGDAASKTVCGNLNAKNAFGGYTGKALFIYEQQSKRVWIASNSDEAGTIMQSCRIAKLEELKAKIALLCKQTPDDPSCKKQSEASR